MLTVAVAVGAVVLLLLFVWAICRAASLADQDDERLRAEERDQRRR